MAWTRFLRGKPDSANKPAESPNPDPVDSVEYVRRASYFLKYINNIDDTHGNINYYKKAIGDIQSDIGLKESLGDHEVSEQLAIELFKRGVERYVRSPRFNWDALTNSTGKELLDLVEGSVGREILEERKKNQSTPEEAALSARAEDIKMRLESSGIYQKMAAYLRNNDELNALSPQGVLREPMTNAILENTIRKFALSTFEPAILEKGTGTRWDNITGAGVYPHESNVLIAEHIQLYLTHEIYEAIGRSKRRNSAAGIE